MMQCLNCEKEVTENFCSECGQKTSTKRFAWWHVLEKDGLSLIVNTDKGIFYTAKELLSRPGHSIREYLQGKRAKHYQYFNYLLVVMAVSYFIGSYADINYSDFLKEGGAYHNRFEAFVSENPKTFALITIPLLAMFSIVWFSKSELNFSEHIVLNMYKLAGETMIGIPFVIVCVISPQSAPLSILFYVTSVLTFLYSVIFYYQLFSAYYPFGFGLFFRSVICSLSLIILTAITLAFLN